MKKLFFMLSLLVVGVCCFSIDYSITTIRYKDNTIQRASYKNANVDFYQLYPLDKDIREGITSKSYNEIRKLKKSDIKKLWDKYYHPYQAKLVLAVVDVMCNVRVSVYRSDWYNVTGLSCPTGYYVDLWLLKTVQGDYYALANYERQ